MGPILLQQASGDTLGLPAVFQSLSPTNSMETKRSKRPTIIVAIFMMKLFAGLSDKQLLWLVPLLNFTSL
jgi:hypothetical protein